MREGFTENEHSQLWLEDNVVYAVFKSNLSITLDIAKKMVEERLVISNQITRPVIVDIRGIISIDTISRKYFASNEAIQFINAGAIIVSGLIPKFTGQIFMKIDRPPIPSRLFTNLDKAKVWLEQYKSSIK